MTPTSMYIRDLIQDITPHDHIETMHQLDALLWIASGAPIFRVAKPDTPPKHLVSYFVVYDDEIGKLLLIDHRKANAWLPPGGHVEPEEDPQHTVRREAQEELQLTADFGTQFGQDPFFITVTETRGQDKHTDVSLWYVIRGNSRTPLKFDTKEIRSYDWLKPQEILGMDIADLDPHMHRFIHKLQTNSGR